MSTMLKICILSLGLLSLTTQVFAQASPPNIVFIMLDDLGWGDVNIYEPRDIIPSTPEHDVATPNIDALALQGMKFNNYHTMGARCSPTRASILTGRDPSNFGFDAGVGDHAERSIPAHVKTLPQALSDLGVGYVSWHVGKWHLGAQEQHHRPCQRGFDQSVRLDTSSDRSDPGIDTGCTGSSAQSTGHATQILTDRAMSLIGNHLGSGSVDPFFLNLWYWAPHKPLDPPDRPSDSVPAGDEHKFLPEHCPSRVDNPTTNEDWRNNFDSLICFADSQIGRLVDYLGEQGVLDNTVIIVTSDNGGTASDDAEPGVPWHGPNASFRGFKTHTFEGGIRVPLIIHWKGQVTAGLEDHSLLYSLDWFPTLVELAGGNPFAVPVDGQSFAPLLLSGNYSPLALDRFWESRYSKDPFKSTTGILNWGAMRRGQWKLVVEPTVGGPHREYLFDVEADPSEQNDLSVFETTLTGSLFDEYLEWRKKSSRIPLNPIALGGAVVLPYGTIEDPAFDYQFDESDPGRVELTSDERKNFRDGHFTFTVDIRPEWNNFKQMIASSMGAWKLVLRDTGIVSLNISVDDPNPNTNTVLESEFPLTAGEWHRVAFTIRHWKGPIPSTVQLIVDDQDVVEASLTAKATTSSVPVSLGSRYDAGFSFPFSGQMRNASLHTLDLYPQQIR